MKLQMKTLIAASLLVAAPTRASIVIDHEPSQAGGPGSDTVSSPLALPFLWQQTADPVNLSSSATIQQVTWWGFYGVTFQAAEPPPTTETMRIRLYGARAGDGLPDSSNNILLEQSSDNAGRTATGRTISVGHLPLEYRYQVNLSTPITLTAGRTYWLEILQVGDPTSDFRWEWSGDVDADIAYINNITGDWVTNNGLGHVAFQLSTTPEPASGILLLMTAAPLLTRRRR